MVVDGRREALRETGVVEIVGDIFSLMTGFDAVGVPTNGDYNKFGDAVMGRSIAASAASSHWPLLAEYLGASLARYGNHTYLFENDVVGEPKFIFSFPTKHHARDRLSDPLLIERSAHELVAIMSSRNFRRVIMTRPGCEYGGLDWEQVRTTLNPILDRRVHVCATADD